MTGIRPVGPYLPLVGTTTNNNAAAGTVGEYISASVARSAITGINSTAANDITSISLTAGDWDVRGDFGLNPAGTTTMSYLAGWISATSATDPGAPNSGAYFLLEGITIAAGNPLCFPAGTIRLSLAATTTVYLSIFPIFSLSTAGAFGFIGARRVR